MLCFTTAVSARTMKHSSGHWIYFGVEFVSHAPKESRFDAKLFLAFFGSFIDKFTGAIASKFGMKFACRVNLLESLGIFLPCFLA
jgi:hypothetical protein